MSASEASFIIARPYLVVVVVVWFLTVNLQSLICQWLLFRSSAEIHWCGGVLNVINFGHSLIYLATVVFHGAALWLAKAGWQRRVSWRVSNGLRSPVNAEVVFLCAETFASSVWLFHYTEFGIWHLRVYINVSIVGWGFATVLNVLISWSVLCYIHISLAAHRGTSMVSFQFGPICFFQLQLFPFPQVPYRLHNNQQ
jgi:hypothetical protein